MTKVKVVDTSALAAVLFGEAEAEAVVARLTGSSLAAPAFLSLELAHVCLVKAERYPDRRDLLKDAFHLVQRLTIRTVCVDYMEALKLAQATGLTVYDASYLWISRDLGCELVTLDQRLAAAAK